MKTLITPLLLLLLLISTFLPFSHSNDDDPVIDYDGDPVVAGEKYYVLPAFRGPGGGITLSSRLKNICDRLYGVQTRFGVDRGHPVIFHQAYPTDDGIIHLRMDFNVEVVFPNSCWESTVWTLRSSDWHTGQRYVTSGGSIGNPGPQTVNNWFRIETADSDTYKIVFCNSMCPSCKVRDCGAVGVREDWDRLLTLHGEELRVMFVRIGSYDWYSAE